MREVDNLVTRSVKVLHVVSSLHHGAVEKWLVSSLFRLKDCAPYAEWTFYCVFESRGTLESDAKKAGATIIHAPCSWEKPLNLVKHLRAELAKGKYDILHAHHDLMSGFYLLAAINLPLKKRWVHVHNADTDIPTPNKVKRILLKPILRWLCLNLADGIIGITNHTLQNFTGRETPRKNDKVIYYGIDTRRFRYNSFDRNNVRKELEISKRALVLLFVGRMNWFKNPCFVIEVLRFISEQSIEVFALFVGEGELAQKINDISSAHKMTRQVRNLGWREDTEKYFSAADLFIFPRIESNDQGIGKEGLGITLIEAQISGLSVLTSFGISDEAIVLPDLFTQISLDNGPQDWSDKAIKIIERNKRIDRSHCETNVAESKFGIEYGVKRLLDLY